jgi:hypothetical protein
MKRIIKSLSAAAAAGVVLSAGLGIVSPEPAAAAAMNVKNHSTTRYLNVRDSQGYYTIGAGATRNMRNGGRAILVPTGWILTKDSITWRSACSGHPSYWAGISWQPTQMDIRWKRCVNP